MKYIFRLVIVICLVAISFGRAFPIVYLNKQWDEQKEEWYTGPLEITGTGLSINREYQNAYGVYMDLPPGPPFIVERLIIIENTYDPVTGEIDDWGKQALLGGARALLFPTRLRESFGLVMIEAMACGTPVIGFRRGAVPEVVQDGATGFVVDDVAAAVQAVERLGQLSRAVCRQVFDDRFTAQRMAEDYVALYRRLMQ